MKSNLLIFLLLSCAFGVIAKKVKVKVTHSCLTLCDSIQSMEFSRPENWNG